ncbi:MAG: hypothetical protein IT381_32300 [Deltaproteobacteria bacterium]|nr:hypothetical protein [Deltaproteobacteria bacterium]
MTRRIPLPKPSLGEQTFKSFTVRSASREAYDYLVWLSSRRPTRGATILCGASGSGKSHLLRACVHEWKKRNEAFAVAAIPATDLLRRYVLPGITKGTAAQRLPRELRGDILIVEHLESLAAQQRSLEAVLGLCARVLQADVRVLLSITAPVVSKKPLPLAVATSQALRPSRALQISGLHFGGEGQPNKTRA